MKNATAYAKKLEELLSTLKKSAPPAAGPDGREPLECLVEGILRAEATAEQARAALEALRREFVDFNEMRVAPAREIEETIEDLVPEPRPKADAIGAVLARVFDQGPGLDVERLREMGKRELRAYLRETMGLDSFTEAYFTLQFGRGGALPVDRRLLERLKSSQCVHPDSDADEARALLERLVSSRDAAAVFEALSSAQFGGSNGRKRGASRASGASARKGSPAKKAKRPARRGAGRKKSDG